MIDGIGKIKLYYIEDIPSGLELIVKATSLRNARKAALEYIKMHEDNDASMEDTSTNLLKFNKSGIAKLEK